MIKKHINQHHHHHRHHAPENNDNINYYRTVAENLVLSKSFSMAFIINSTEDWAGMFYVIAKQPSLVKIILNYKECYSNRAIYEHRIEKFAKQLWNEYRVLHIYFIPLCWNEKMWWRQGQQHHQYKLSSSSSSSYYYGTIVDEQNEICFLDDIYFYDAFEIANTNDDNHTTRGRIQKYNFRSHTLTAMLTNPSISVSHMTINAMIPELNQSTNTIRNNLKSFNEILKRKKFLNLNGMDLNVSFLSSTNSYLMADMKFCGANFSAQQLLMNKCVSSTQSSMGIDMEMLRELSRRVMFTPYIIDPSDGKYYGFRVGTFICFGFFFFAFAFDNYKLFLCCKT